MQVVSEPTGNNYLSFVDVPFHNLEKLDQTSRRSLKLRDPLDHGGLRPANSALWHIVFTRMVKAFPGWTLDPSYEEAAEPIGADVRHTQ
jgi:hypothetical protein